MSNVADGKDGQQVRVDKRLSFYDARKLVETTQPAMVATSYDAVVKEERSVLFNDALNTFYLQLYGVRHMVKDNSAREETCCRHMGYSFHLAERVILYAPSHRQNNTYHGLWYTSRGALAGTRSR